MAWVNWSRKSASEENPRGSLGLELNSGRARAAAGKAGKNRIIPLDDPHPDLPLTLSLEKRALEVGRAGVALVRRLPHLTCAGFLPYLGQAHEWKGGRH